MNLPRAVSAAVAAVGLVVALAGCGSARGDAGDGRLDVVAAFYPVQYAVEQVGGSRVRVTGLTRPGAEPHDVELTPRQVGRVALADLVLFQRGFQPAVDAAVDREGGHHSLDVAPAARLDVPADAGHEDEPSDDHDAAGVDPHFWLDPLRYADVGDLIARSLAVRDPAGAAAYEDNARRFRAALVALDREYAAGLARCHSTELVTSHAAFGYLAQRYGLHQEGITGLDPEAEPDPASLARVAAHVRESAASTVYAEVLVSHDVARTLARETGARMAVLDPIEGITDESEGEDYFAVMRANLATLRSGQECS